MRIAVLGTGYVANVPPEHLQDFTFLSLATKGERSCSFPLEKLSLFSPPSPRAESIAQGVSPSADGDKGCSPLTSTAFSEEKAAQKNFCNRVRSHGRLESPKKKRRKKLL
jgi:hypothetical protein